MTTKICCISNCYECPYNLIQFSEDGDVELEYCIVIDNENRTTPDVGIRNDCPLENCK